MTKSQNKEGGGRGHKKEKDDVIYEQAIFTWGVSGHLLLLAL